ncbi:MULTISPECIES: HU family DNA-binding protein [Acetobacteraceae]|uniref:Integration host factor n=1 Tax=Kozakia baliensis TaxID=153496 RepID=A0A1D8UYN3_9PROT|nr:MULTISPECIES: HU family DNA-binding protein [Acetobacteraceae]AOX18706.1 integration host factor [Kozakia baliensis]AOX21452.1 integration host factor [Kozakia baliensis]MCG4255100.1 HU family DNA-binding protein [Acetobacter senegalensis]GBR29386.1 histone-like DNA-binding protein HU [Kozakia baliensis NRIC 0488]GEL65842.1 integration host factor [Kozakia baliensis]
MKHTELVDQIAQELDVSKKEAADVVNAVFSAVTNAAVKGEEISVSGFGKFAVRTRPAREGRNPATGETIQLAESRSLGFTAAKAVKEALTPAKTAPVHKKATPKKK